MYTSGRTVKSTVTRPSTLSQATSATRAVAKNTVGVRGLTFDTRRGYDLARDVAYFATTVTYPEGTNVADFAACVKGSAGVFAVDSTATHTVVFRYA